MKTIILFTLSLILSVFSQSIQIASPTNDTGVESGKDLNVMLVFPSVMIPTGQKSPNLLLTVAHFMLVGASSSPVLEYKNVTLLGNMVSSGGD
ncbi:hypothetical protein PM082_017394 [Marasmius tenuissimus]|nr:hypothetical protein PM082_017394 [Marasmius tenuissimus]